MDMAAEDTTGKINKKNNLNILIENERRLICNRSLTQLPIRNNNVNRIEHEFYVDTNKNKNFSNETKLKCSQKEKMLKEINNLKQEELVDLKMRQHIRETSDELRQLEAKLRNAYVSKALAAQIAEKECLKYEEKQNEQKANMMLNKALIEVSELERIRKEDSIKKKAKYRQELQDQMIMHHQEKQYEYEEFLRDKKMIDDIIRRIQDEDLRMMEEKMIKQNLTKLEIKAFKEAQEVWKAREKEAIIEENERIVAFLKQKEKDTTAFVKRKLEKEAMRKKMIENMGEQMLKEQVKKREREEILQDLLEEEMKERDEQNIRKEFEKMLRTRIETRNTLERQLKEREAKLREEEKQDALYRQQLLEKIQLDEKLEQMTAEKRRIKMIEYRRSIEETIKERRARRTEELKEIMYLYEQEKLYQENRKKVIEAERLRLLKEHALNLVGYLPQGLLREEDLPHLGSQFVEQYSNK